MTYNDTIVSPMYSGIIVGYVWYLDTHFLV